MQSIDPIVLFQTSTDADAELFRHRLYSQWSSHLLLRLSSWWSAESWLFLYITLLSLSQPCASSIWVDATFEENPLLFEFAVQTDQMLSRVVPLDVSFCLAVLFRVTHAILVAPWSTRFAMSVHLRLPPWKHVAPPIDTGQGDLTRRSRFQHHWYRAGGGISLTTGSSTNPPSIIGIHRSISFGQIKCQSNEYRG